MSIAINTFETFIEDTSNRLALGACREITQHSFSNHNLLWIYGPSACGKSHLLNAIFHKLETERTVLFFSAESLTETMVEAMISNSELKNKAWKNIQNADVLIVDNLEYLKGKITIQEKIAMMCIKKQANQQKVIFASNCSPVELPALENILLNRGNSELVAKVQIPSASLKRRYIEAIIEAESIKITVKAKRLLVSQLKTVSQINGLIQTARFDNQNDELKIDLKCAKKHIDNF